MRWNQFTFNSDSGRGARSDSTLRSPFGFGDPIDKVLCMPESPVLNELDRLATKMGQLALATGWLEVAIIEIVCRIQGKSERELNNKRGDKEYRRSNSEWCKDLKKIAPLSWSDSERETLFKKLDHIRAQYVNRNELTHACFAIAEDDTIPGIPRGSVIDWRTFGTGFVEVEKNTFALTIIAKKVDLQQIDDLTENIHQARMALLPFWTLANQISHPDKRIRLPAHGKLLKDCI